MCICSAYDISSGILETKMNPDTFPLRVDVKVFFKPESDPQQKSFGYKNTRIRVEEAVNISNVCETKAWRTKFNIYLLITLAITFHAYNHYSILNLFGVATHCFVLVVKNSLAFKHKIVRSKIISQ